MNDTLEATTKATDDAKKQLENLINQNKSL